MKEPRYPICPECLTSLDTPEALIACTCCGLQFETVQDLDEQEPQDPPEPEVWQSYELQTNDDGTITGNASTNDDDDDGYPDEAVEAWYARYPNREEMLNGTGGTHTGCCGLKVSVWLDGKLIDREGKEITDKTMVR